LKPPSSKSSGGNSDRSTEPPLRKIKKGKDKASAIDVDDSD
jgi:hypothetical protein